MPKRIFQVVALLGFSLAARICGATDLVKEAPINQVGMASTVSISTTSWTKVPTTRTQTVNRSGIKVSNPKTNSATIVGLISAGTPTTATTVRPIEIEVGENPFIPVGDGEDLYLFSLNTSAENAHVQEVRQ